MLNKVLVFLTQLLTYFTLFYILPYATHTHSCHSRTHQRSKYAPWIEDYNAQSNDKSEKELLSFKTRWTMTVPWVKTPNERENVDKHRMTQTVTLCLGRYTSHWHLLHWTLTFQTQYENSARKMAQLSENLKRHRARKGENLRGNEEKKIDLGLFLALAARFESHSSLCSPYHKYFSSRHFQDRSQQWKWKRDLAETDQYQELYSRLKHSLFLWKN